MIEGVKIVGTVTRPFRGVPVLGACAKTVYNICTVMSSEEWRDVSNGEEWFIEFHDADGNEYVATMYGDSHFTDRHSIDLHLKVLADARRSPILIVDGNDSLVKIEPPLTQRGKAKFNKMKNEAE